MRVRKPGAERPERAFQRQAHGKEADRHRQRKHVIAGGRQFPDLLPHRFHQQVAGDMVQDDNADQEQSGAQQAHDQVADRRRQRHAAPVPDHDQRAGCQRIDFNEHIRRKDVVGEYQRQQGGHQQAGHAAVQLDLVRFRILQDMRSPARQDQDHHDRESRRDERLQRADPDFIAPGSRKMAHQVPVAFPGPDAGYRGCRRHGGDCRRQSQRQRHGGPGLQRGAGHAAGQAEHNRRKRKILNQRHFSSSVRAMLIIRSSSSVWYRR